MRTRILTDFESIAIRFATCSPSSFSLECWFTAFGNEHFNSKGLSV